MNAPRFVLAALLVVAPGCASRPVGPADTVRAYAQSLREGHFDEAYLLLSAEARRALPYERFVALARSQPETVQDAVASFSAVSPEAPITARVELASGETVTLLHEGGQWRLDPAALDFYGQRTPQQALRSFVRALERQRWAVLVDLAPREEVARMEAMARDADGGTGTAADVLRALGRERSRGDAGDASAAARRAGAGTDDRDRGRPRGDALRRGTAIRRPPRARRGPVARGRPGLTGVQGGSTSSRFHSRKDGRG